MRCQHEGCRADLRAPCGHLCCRAHSFCSYEVDGVLAWYPEECEVCYDLWQLFCNPDVSAHLIFISWCTYGRKNYEHIEYICCHIYILVDFIYLVICLHLIFLFFSFLLFFSLRLRQKKRPVPPSTRGWVASRGAPRARPTSWRRLTVLPSSPEPPQRRWCPRTRETLFWLASGSIWQNSRWELGISIYP